MLMLRCNRFVAAGLDDRMLVSWRGYGMQVATYVDGRGIEYDEATTSFSIDGVRLTNDQVREYDGAGQLTWVSGDMRNWFYQMLGQPPAPIARQAAAQPAKKKTGLIVAIIVGVLLVCGACSVFGSLGDDDIADTASQPAETSQEPAAEEPAAEEPAAEEPAAEEDVAPKIGEPLKVGDLVFTVQDAQTTKELKSVFGDKTGYWMIVTVTVKNESKEAVTMNTSFFKLIESDGTVYETDSDSLLYLDAEDSFFLEDINPKLEKTGKVLFAIPEGVTDLQLQVQTGAWGTQTGLISLVK